MKSHLFLLPLLAMAPVVASAQTKSATPKKATPATKPKAATKPATKPAAPSAPQISMDPAAKALLDQATATYKNASGLRLGVATIADGKDTDTGSVAFSRPNLVSIERKSGSQSLHLLLDGSDLYQVEGTSYRKSTAPAGLTATQLVGSVSTLTGIFVSAMLDGKNTLDARSGGFAKPPFQNFKSKTVALAPSVVDGETLSAVQSTFSVDFPMPSGKAASINQQITAYFGGSPLLLRRVQVVSTPDKGKTTTSIEKVVDQQLNPIFAADTFKFNETGLKLAEEPSYFDPRLKVGAEPFAFQTKTMSGETISPANYKGKVLLMDFWATWCGPCVASLPELQGAYNKYHAQGLEVVGISLDEDKDALTSFVKTKKMAWPQVFDGKGWGAEVPGIYGVKAIPFMLIIGKDGKIAAVNPRGNIDAAVKAALAAS